ncbi:helix-turn-helix domain-containing protein [Desertivirga arenae]|uniref:helix-turn-helix domain-containing protein n=1 Tax=Desertivirga arenae TaxID=2810309 RepID=UPI001A96BC3E|nr:helix-turn-helix domain-containing protein [Pedobacter sp. SYSU D00823]
MKKEQVNNLSKTDFKAKKLFLRLLHAAETIEENTAELIRGLHYLIVQLEEREGTKVIPIARKKQQEFRESWLDKQEVMQLMPISERSLYTLRKQGDLPSYSLKGKVYFKLSDVEALMRGKPGDAGVAV